MTPPPFQRRRRVGPLRPHARDRVFDLPRLHLTPFDDAFQPAVLDEGYGRRTGFLAELDAPAQLRWVGEVPKSFRRLTARPKGKKPRKGWTGKRADRLAPFSWAFRDRAWRRVSLKRQTLGEQAWQAKSARSFFGSSHAVTSRCNSAAVSMRLARHLDFVISVDGLELRPYLVRRSPRRRRRASRNRNNRREQEPPREPHRGKLLAADGAPPSPFLTASPSPTNPPPCRAGTAPPAPAAPG